ncbi:MAG: transposase, partial [Desulfobacterales bacterium]|nr:transposase [Desulfobacterales bacterium]
MYVRRTTIKSRKDGRQYYTYRLVQSERTAKGVRQRTLINLGTDFSLPRDQWSELSSRIQEIISGQQSFFKISEEIEELAQNYAARIIQAQQKNKADNDRPDYHEVNADSLEMLRPRSVSCEHVALEAFDFLKLGEKLKALGFNGPQLAAAVGTIIGRMCQPGSEPATHYWLRNVSGLGELIDYDFNKINLYKMYKISDQLLNNKEAIENHLYLQEKNLFGFQETITLYDLTNTCFEGSSKANELGKRGHSKEKRSDCPLVTLALVLDSSGFPKHSKVFDGNVNKPSTLAKMINGLERKNLSRKPFEPLKATIVMDAGIATEDNIAWLKGNSYPYIVVSRKRHQEFNEDEAVVVKQDDDCTVKVQKVIDSDNDEVLYKIEVYKDEKTGNAVKILWTRQTIADTKDSYCLRTTHTELDETALWRTYTMLTDLKAVFRSLKSEPGMRPVFHQLTKRATAHLFISILAYHLIHSICYRLKKTGINSSWSDLRKQLTGQSRITISMQCRDDAVVHVRKSTQPEPRQQKIYSALELFPLPGKTIKTIINGMNN